MCSSKPTSLYLTLQCTIQVFKQAYIPISGITMYIAGVQTSLHPYIWHYNVHCRCSNKPTSLYLTLQCAMQVFNQAYIPISDITMYIAGVQTSLHPYIWHYNVQFRCSNKPTSLYLTLLCSLQVFKQAYIPISDITMYNTLQVFKQAYIPRTLDQVIDIERDVMKQRKGGGEEVNSILTIPLPCLSFYSSFETWCLKTFSWTSS